MAKPYKYKPAPKSNKQVREEAARKAYAKEQKRLAEERKKERSQARSAQGEAVLRRKPACKDPVAALDAIERGTLKAAQVAKTSPMYWMCSIYESIYKNPNNYTALKPGLRVFKKVLLHCYHNSDLFEGRQETKNYINGLLAVSAHYNRWIRPIEDWKPQSHNAWRQFNSLVRHLFAKYEVPYFMNTAWYGGINMTSVKYQDWFIHIGQGQNIRTARDLPMAMTKKMAHNFLHAPSDFDIPSAFRYAQVLALGGDERLVRSILGTRLSAMVGLEDEFWLSVVRWLIANPMLDTVHHGPILDYINDQKYVRQVPNPDPTGPRLIPHQPNFTMKGRNPETLLRQVENWHRRLGREAKRGGPDLTWLSSGIMPFEWTEGEGENRKVYTINELLSSKELREEGNAMKHCVGSYTQSCSRGNASIWSLKCYTSFEVIRLLTIEVRNRTIVQARRKLNEMPGPKDFSILQRWSSSGGPKISQWIR